MSYGTPSRVGTPYYSLGGNMKVFAKAAFAAALLGSASLAGSISPSDVQFGENGEIKASLTE